MAFASQAAAGLWAALLLAAPACGRSAQAPSLVTRNGVAVHLGEHSSFLTAAQAEAMEDYLVERLDEVGYPTARSRECLGAVEVHVVDASYRCFGNRKCAGEQWDNVLYVVATGCAFTSAYLHELAHWLQQCVRGGYDPEHRDSAVWPRVAAFPERCGEPAPPGVAGAAASELRAARTSTDR